MQLFNLHSVEGFVFHLKLWQQDLYTCSNKTAMSDFIFFKDFYFGPLLTSEFNQNFLYILEIKQTDLESEKCMHSIKEILPTGNIQQQWFMNY
jgi:hypothetical protein